MLLASDSIDKPVSAATAAYVIKIVSICFDLLNPDSLLIEILFVGTTFQWTIIRGNELLHSSSQSRAQ